MCGSRVYGLMGPGYGVLWFWAGGADFKGFKLMSQGFLQRV